MTIPTNFNPPQFPNDHEPNKDPTQYAVYHKAVEVFELTRAIVDLMDSNNDEDPIKKIMMEDAMIQMPKIAGAVGAHMYGLQLENAYIMKVHARNLQATTNMLYGKPGIDKDYVKLLRQRIDEYREEFLKWVATFDPANDAKGEWDFH